MLNNDLVKAAIAAIVFGFAAVFFADLISKLALTPPYDAYLAVVLSACVMLPILYWIQNRR